MRALSLKQPFAALIVAGVQRYEARSWSTPYRGRIAIHASSKRTEGWILEEWDNVEDVAAAYAQMGWIDKADLASLPRSAVIGTVSIVEIHIVKDVWERLTDADKALVGNPFEDDYLWELQDAVAIEPVPINGKLNLWTLPDDVAAVVERERARAAERKHAGKVPPERVKESLRLWRERRAAREAEVEVFLNQRVRPEGKLAEVIGGEARTRRDVRDWLGAHLDDTRLWTSDESDDVRIDATLRRVVGGRRKTMPVSEIVEIVNELLSDERV